MLVETGLRKWDKRKYCKVNIRVNIFAFVKEKIFIQIKILKHFIIGILRICWTCIH